MYARERGRGTVPVRPEPATILMRSPTVNDAEQAERHNSATAARIYDYLLGGVHNYPADRELAQTVVSSFPLAAAGIRANRAFLRRAVRHLTASGVRQFLDVGSGIPTVG